MFGHDPQHTGVAGESVEPPLELLWKFKTGDRVDQSSPAVSGGTVYIGSRDGYVYAIDAATGTEKWKYETGGLVTSSPAIFAGTVYIGSWDGYVYALDAATGTEKWKCKTGGDVWSSPAIYDNTVYIGSFDGYLYALDAATGTEKWKCKTDDSIQSSPAVAGGTVYIGSNDGYVYALDTDTGNEKWKCKKRAGSSSTVSGDTVYVGSGDGVYALDAATGEEKWKYETNGSVSSPAVSGSTIYVGVYISFLNSYVCALDANRGEEKWRRETKTLDGYSSPAVSGSIIYIDYLSMYAFDAHTGEEKWKYETGGGWSSPAVSEGVVYVGSSDYCVYAFTTETVTPSPTPTPTPSVTVIDCSPSPVHSGEGLDVQVNWANIPADWKLVVSLEKAEWDKSRLADDVSAPVSGSAEGVFTLKVDPTTETYKHAKVWACFYKGNEWKHVFDDMGIVVISEPTKAPTTGSISVSSSPSGADIYLDGTYQGTTPTTISDAPPGSHALKLEKYGYAEWLTSVHVTSGVTESITARLTATDVSPPAIRIDKPATIDQNNNGLLEEGEKVTITYGANDPGGVTSIRIMLDGTTLESQNRAGTYTVTTSPLLVGRHTIRVVATDSKSNSGFEELPITVERSGPSVYFGTTRTTIKKGEDAIFTLSAVNPIGNPPMTVQLILKPPSGVSVTSSSFAKAGSGIYTCTQTIESGDNVRSIEVRLTGGQVGVHEIASEVYYRFTGSPKSPTRYETLTLVVAPEPLATTLNSGEPENRVPGFSVVAAGTILFAIYLWRKRA